MPPFPPIPRDDPDPPLPDIMQQNRLMAAYLLIMRNRTQQELDALNQLIALQTSANDMLAQIVTNTNRIP